MLSLWLIVVEWDERIFKKLTKKAFEKLKSKNRWDLAPTCLDISAPTLLKSTRRFCLYCKYFRITFGLRIANIQGCRSQWAGGTLATSELADQFTLSQQGRGQILRLSYVPAMYKIPVFNWFSSCLDYNLLEGFKESRSVISMKENEEKLAPREFYQKLIIN